MLWEDVEKKYGKEIADKMKDSEWLKGITVSIDPKTGKTDIPESDIDRAYRALKGEKISVWEWD